jgi:hypothetical protein
MSGAQAEMWGRVASMVLKIYEAEVDEERTAVVHVPGSPPDTMGWTGKDLAGQTEATVPLDLVLPRSRAAMAALAEKALQMGMITTIEEFSRVAELPGERDMIDAIRPDVGRARRENHHMALNHPRLPEDWDDHAIHIKEHNVFRMGARYDALGADEKELFALHVQAHEVLAAEEAGKAQMRANEGGAALAAAPTSDGAIAEPEEMLPEDPNAIPPPEDQTTLDKLTGDTVMAVAREDAEAASTGAAVDQQDIERDALLELMQLEQGRV